MKFIPTVLAVLLVAGCNQSKDKAAEKAPVASTPSAVPTALPTALAIDISTPDRALKSYWQSKDAIRKAEFDWYAEQIPELQKKLKIKIGYDPRRLMVSDVLSAHQERENPTLRPPEEYSREIVSIKQDTESRATALVVVKNTTPLPERVVVSEFDKKQRDGGETFRYILEKDSEGWKVSQAYHLSLAKVALKEPPWEKIFSAKTDGESAIGYVNTSDN